VAYTSHYDNVLLASYLWDAHVIEVGVPTARMENHSIQMAYVCLQRVGVERFRSKQPFVKDHHIVMPRFGSVTSPIYGIRSYMPQRMQISQDRL